MTTIVDGRDIGHRIREQLKELIAELKEKYQEQPSLGVILVGDHHASRVYVAHKEKACSKLGLRSNTIKLSSETSENELIELIEALNKDRTTDGILVQLPLPSHLNTPKILNSIAPIKDVDGLGLTNQGLLSLNLPGHRPCTPFGIMKLLSSSNIKIDGKHAVIVGRSSLVGSPMARLLTHANATVTTLHSHSLSPSAVARQADILVAAAGVAGLVKKSWIKEGAVVIDVGIHRQEDGTLQGDVDPDGLNGYVSHLTPVPGGVGPMTIASLLANCLQAYQWRRSGENPYLQ